MSLSGINVHFTNDPVHKEACFLPAFHSNIYTFIGEQRETLDTNKLCSKYHTGSRDFVDEGGKSGLHKNIRLKN